VAIASPTGGTVSSIVAISVTASDNVGDTRVDLRLNGATTASDSTSPYQFSWDSTKVANGTVALTAVAFDAAGNSTVSAPVYVNVSNATTLTTTTDTTPPTVTFTSPGNGAAVSGTVTVNTSASDNSGSAGISQWLYIDGALTATASGAPLSYKWNTRKVAKGSHSLQVTARDKAGNSATTTIGVVK
jgi:hypothetical protein